MTTTDIELLRMTEAVAKAWDASQTPPELRESFAAWSRAHEQHVLHLQSGLLAQVCWWTMKAREQGHDGELVDEVALQQAQAALAVVARAMARRQRRPFEPGRFAIVAYTVACEVATAGGEDPSIDPAAVSRMVDEVASSIERERDELREIIDQIADMDIGDIEMEHREIVALCRRTQKRWTEDE